MRLTSAFAWIAIPSALAASLALGHGGASGIVKERMDQMDTASKAMKALNAMLKERVPFDGVEGARLAATVASYGGATLTKLFPEGSLHKPTEALPQIWSDWVRFETLADEMTSTASSLAESLRMSQGAPRDFREQFLDVANTCKSCHDDFRLEK